jgi:hypothetical protein
VKGEAAFSECGVWRWWLTRVWDESLPMACLIGMNPSTATASEDDPTVRKEITFVRSWGYGGMLKLNAFGYRATDPSDLWRARERGFDVIGKLNSAQNLLSYMRQFETRVAVACWGRLRTDRGWYLRNSFTEAGMKLDCIKKNSDGSPAHPLYLPYGLLLEPWNYTESNAR